VGSLACSFWGDPTESQTKGYSWAGQYSFLAGVLVGQRPFVPTTTNEGNKSVKKFFVGVGFINPVNLSQT